MVTRNPQFPLKQLRVDGIVSTHRARALNSPGHSHKFRRAGTAKRISRHQIRQMNKIVAGKLILVTLIYPISCRSDLLWIKATAGPVEERMSVRYNEL